MYRIAQYALLRVLGAVLLSMAFTVLAREVSGSKELLPFGARVVVCGMWCIALGYVLKAPDLERTQKTETEAEQIEFHKGGGL